MTVISNCFFGSEMTEVLKITHGQRKYFKKSNYEIWLHFDINTLLHEWSGLITKKLISGDTHFTSFIAAAYPAPAPPPPPPPPRASASHLHHHHHLEQHQQQHPSHMLFESESMANLVGTDLHNNHRRWRSRSSPAPVHRGDRLRHRHWHQSHGDLNYLDENPHFQQPSPQMPRSFMHNSFHDLHAANEMRASRHDLRELRDLLHRRNHDSIRSSTRRSMHERKWVPGSPSCRRCSDGPQFRY